MKKKKYHIVRAIPKSDIEFVGGGDTTNTQAHDRSLYWYDTGTSIQCGGVKLYLRAQT